MCQFVANFGWRFTSHHANLLWRGFRVGFQRGLTYLRMHCGRQSFHAIDKAAQTKIKFQNWLRKLLWNMRIASPCGFLIRPADRWLTLFISKTRLRLPPYVTAVVAAGAFGGKISLVYHFSPVLFTLTLLFMARNYNLENIPGEDQRVEDDYIDELIRKYLCSEDMSR